MEEDPPTYYVKEGDSYIAVEKITGSFMQGGDVMICVILKDGMVKWVEFDKLISETEKLIRKMRDELG
jgi:hypothetical protein